MAQSSPDTAILLMGPSQAGKSTSLLVDMVDGHVIFDSDLRLTEEGVAEAYSMAVAENNLKRVKILVFEPLADTRRSISRSLEELTKAFGEQILPGVVIVVTHWSGLKEDLKEKRLSAVCEVADKFGIHERVPWDSPGELDQSQLTKQIQDLRDALSRVRGVQTSQLQSLEQKFAQRAQKLFETQPVKMQLVEVEKVITEEYTEPEEVLEPKEEERTVKRTKWEERTEVEREIETIKKPRSGIAGWFGATQEEIRTRERPVRKWVPKEHEELEKYTTWVRVEKTVTKTRQKTVKETKEVQIPPKPLEDFVPQALAEVLAEIRKSMRSKPKSKL